MFFRKTEGIVDVIPSVEYKNNYAVQHQYKNFPFPIIVVTDSTQNTIQIGFLGDNTANSNYS